MLGEGAIATGRRGDPRIGRLVHGLIAVAALTSAVVAMDLIVGGPDAQPALSNGWSLVVLLIPGGTLLFSGLFAALRTRDRGTQPATGGAMLLEMAGMLWFLMVWNDPTAGALVFLIGRLASTLCPVVAVHAALRRQGGVRRVERCGLWLGYLCTGLLAGLVPVLFAEPRLAGCRDCPSDPLLVLDAANLAGAASWVAVWGGMASSGIVALAQFGRLRGDSPVRRRFDGPIAVATMGVCVTVLIGSAAALVSAGAGPADVDAGLWIALGIALTAVAFGAAWPWVAVRLTRIQLTRLVVETAAGTFAGDLSATLGRLLDDPEARLLYPVPGGPLVDSHGRPALPSSTSSRVAMTRLERGGSTMAYLAHDRRTLDTGGQITDEITRAIRLVLDNERFQAQRSWHLRQLQDSRRRLVAESDRTRRSLERNLHDGAQQTLVALAFALSVAELRSATPQHSALLGRAGAEVSAALAELRLVARGIFPRELGDEGLGPALELLAESAAIPVTITVELPQRPSVEIESAAYFAIRSALEPQLDGTGAPALVDVRRCDSGSTDPASGDSPEHGWLTAEIRTDTPRSDPIAIEDRVGAVGGRMTSWTETSGSCVRLELPCGS